MQAVRDPLGMPLATDVVAGERADAPLYVPCMQRVQESIGRHGLLYVGDCTMASRETRAFVAAQGDFYLCPLPAVPLAKAALDEAVDAVGSGAHTLSPVFRERPDGQPEQIAEGYDYEVPMRLERAGESQSWTERRLVVRSVRQAQAAEKAWRVRVATALAAVEALNQRGRGKRRFEEVSTLRPAVVAIVPRYGVAAFWWRRYSHHATPRAVRAYRGQPARVAGDRHATVEVRVDEAALEVAVRRWGWRVYGTNQPREQLSLAQAVGA
jgi:transposase